MIIIYLLLLIGACVCFGLAVPPQPRIRFNLIALGLLLATLVPLIRTIVRID